MKLGIGIDTGGTYTDAVIYDFENGKILGSAKSLTTPNDLTIGILGAIDGLPIGLARQAATISLSTTLATNACVEDKGGRAKLIFFGGDEKTLRRNGKKYGLPDAGEIYLQESFTSFSGAIEREPDWEQFRLALDEGFDDLDGVGIVEINAVRNGAVVERKAKEIFEQKKNIPVVCGHELFSELNCLQRSSSTLLNAGLFPVIREFLDAVKRALAQRGIAPERLVIVRSDGSLMSESFASLHPVETLLCGPAASAVGCARLAESPDGIVVDMGGTTTDIALLRGGEPVAVTDGVSIGRWKTFVSGLYVKTFGLGGDTAVHYDGEFLRLEEDRVIPLCVAAAQYPQVKENLRKLEKRRHTQFLYEHFMLLRDISDSPRYTDEEKAFCAALKDGPLLITEAAAAVGREIYTLKVDRLIKDGVVRRCGLTPTDAMHLKGDFTRFDEEASRLGAEFAAFNLGISVDELCDQIYDAVEKRMYIQIVRALMENKDAKVMKNGVSPDVEKFIAENYEAAKRGQWDDTLSMSICTQLPLIGVGAPIGVFLDDVARLLGTRAIIPENYPVANALGAILGSVSATVSVEVHPDNGVNDSFGYTVFGKGFTQTFDEQEDALACAVEVAKREAREEALRRGVTGEIAVSAQVREHNVKTRDGFAYMGTTVIGRAAGV